LSMFWRGFTTRGAQASILFGTISTLLLIYLSPTIQIDLLKHSSAYFPYRNPGLFTIPSSFIVGILTSLLAPEPAAQEGFARLEHQIHVGEEAPV
jgi:cation/acetate symporter